METTLEVDKNVIGDVEGKGDKQNIDEAVRNCRSCLARLKKGYEAIKNQQPKRVMTEEIEAEYGNLCRNIDNSFVTVDTALRGLETRVSPILE